MVLAEAVTTIFQVVVFIFVVALIFYAMAAGASRGASEVMPLGRNNNRNVSLFAFHGRGADGAYGGAYDGGDADSAYGGDADSAYGGDADSAYGGESFDSHYGGYGAVGGAIGGGHFRLKVSDPEYTALLDGKKVVEARLDRQPFNKLSVGDHVVVVRSRPVGDTSEYPGGRYKFDAEIVRVTKYKNLEALLKAEGIHKVYPGHKDHKEAAEKFSMYLPPGTSVNDPVVAFEFKQSKPSSLKSATKSHVSKREHRHSATFAPSIHSARNNEWRY